LFGIWTVLEPLQAPYSHDYCPLLSLESENILQIVWSPNTAAASAKRSEIRRAARPRAASAAFQNKALLSQARAVLALKDDSL